MASVTYAFTRIAPGRFKAVDPSTGATVGTVFGSSNDWRAHPVDGGVINNAYARKQDAAAACHNARHWVRGAGQI